jgi:hypothetical protein
VGYQPAGWAAGPPEGVTLPGHLREAGLAPDGIPSFDAFAETIKPGCTCCDSSQADAIRAISLCIEFDQTLTERHKDLASDMVRHFDDFANTACKNSFFSLGIVATVNSI